MQDLDNETLNHVDAENRRQTLEEEIEFLKQVQEQVSWQVLEGHSGVWRLYSSGVGWLALWADSCDMLLWHVWDFSK